MTVDLEAVASPELVASMVLQYQVEKFYNDEAALLDAHKHEQWVELFSEDTHYFMPIRRTRLRRELAKEFTKPGEMAYFDDDKELLQARWKKLASGASWAEDPPSRTRHLITNVRVTEDRGAELSVESNFHVYRTRLKTDVDSWVGSRQDVLRRNGDSFLIARRLILLDQSVVLSRNLTTMF
ncbi:MULTISPECIES: aromatic-ring-hydroxylating dioxygenase subunit beta [Actinomadura]|uniref:Biphenyl 2,3-dioxygenase beta subunit n=1 Tax=Actinomadura madurae TaxID=1993 RepID=A0A1I5XAL1_9ACTN|nr:3-phenylpropionate/cinnamic acid dioxygenase subunit beta [Actinomadura madurae]SFQ28687.1 biphenyl 2,3-dioxygenase beta subunit [Actinomadura madurae]SPT59100.1 Biphenyl dioxygenase subunit beta [Actinomadura madurae]